MMLIVEINWNEIVIIVFVIVISLVIVSLVW